MSTSKTRVVFFPGLGADSRLSRFHRDLPFDMRWMDWLEPEEDEPLDAFAPRMGRTARATPGDYLAGISMGGTVALEIARVQGARGVILLGSPRCGADVAPDIRAARMLIPAVPDKLILSRQIPYSILRGYFGVESEEHCALLLDMTSTVGPTAMRRLARMILDVGEEIRAAVPILSIHGTLDRTVPFRPDRGHVPIEGAGHMFTMTHPREVNAEIIRFVR